MKTLHASAVVAVLLDDCDGGCNWGVLYDATGEFSQFGVNGIA